jgi:hypothetical protein
MEEQAKYGGPLINGWPIEKSFVITFQSGVNATIGQFDPVCKVEADYLQSDNDFDQLIDALQKAKVSLRLLRQQSLVTSPGQR